MLVCSFPDIILLDSRIMTSQIEEPLIDLENANLSDDVYAFGGQSCHVSGTHRRQICCYGKSVSFIAAKGSRCFALITGTFFI